jgi:glycosyltransferase involved in cell wall biosynthesis
MYVKDLISVIIPVYNVELYLEKCLNSVINQTYNNLEIICVNDCSTDESLDIIKKYALKDKRIQIIDKKINEGSGVAKNNGFAISNGEYIYFMDSDDWIENDYLEVMYNAIKFNNVDVVYNCSFVSHKEYDFLYPLRAQNYQEGFISPRSLYPQQWLYLIRRNILPLNPYMVGYNSDDVFFQHTIFYQLEKIFVINKSSYHYIIRSNSLSSSFHNIAMTSHFGSLIALEEIYKFYKENNLLYKMPIPIDWDEPLHMMERHTEKEKFFQRYKQFFLSCKDDVLKYLGLYKQEQLSHFYNIITKESYIDYKINSVYYIVNGNKIRRVLLFNFLPILLIKSNEKYTRYKLFFIIPILKIKTSFKN